MDYLFSHNIPQFQCSIALLLPIPDILSYQYLLLSVSHLKKNMFPNVNNNIKYGNAKEKLMPQNWTK